jgi:4-hydroxy-tetrahydrodipicolinate reductase
VELKKFSQVKSEIMKIAIAGASGRMGRMLIEAVLQLPDATLVGALDHASCPVLGADAGAFLGKKTGVMITADLADGLRDAEYLIDFTRPEGTMLHLAACTAHGVKMIIGTTGLSADQIAQLKTASSKIAIVFAPNMSVGVNVTLKLLEVAAKMLDTGYDIEIIEAHHRHKVDAPSGTALKMGEVIAGALGQSLSDVAVFAREGHTGERKSGSIGFATIRGGDIVGDHTVLFAGEGERIEISHKSSSRQSYAQGSIRAARFLEKKTTGLFDMQDVLGLRS